MPSIPMSTPAAILIAVIGGIMLTAIAVTMGWLQSAPPKVLVGLFAVGVFVSLILGSVAVQALITPLDDWA